MNQVAKMQGKTQSAWKVGNIATNEVAIPVQQLKRGVYMLEPAGAGGRSATSILVP